MIWRRQNLIWVVGLLPLLGGLSVGVGMAQEPVGKMVVFDSVGENLKDQRIQDRVKDIPIGLSDETLRIDRELRFGEAVVTTRSLKEDSKVGPRVRSRATVDEDRARVKREVAISQ